MKGSPDPIRVAGWTPDRDAEADALFKDYWEIDFGHPELVWSEPRWSFGLEYWPEYSVGSYPSNTVSPREVSWSYTHVANNLTASGLARLYHEFSMFAPINPLDELVNRCQARGVGVAEVTQLSLFVL